MLLNLYIIFSFPYSQNQKENAIFQVMKLHFNLKNTFVEATCLLYVMLFVYAAVSKLLDFENFQVQLGQSPLLNPFAGEISYAIPILEIVAAVVLSFPKFRKVGLLVSFALMVLFTAYIYYILNFSSFVPCSCGGILEKMGWKEHFIFNCFFILISVVAIFLLTVKENIKQILLTYSVLVTLAIVGVGTLDILLIISENKRFQRNNFVRMFPPIPVKRETIYNLKYNSYYFAGKDNQSVFLGNTTAPLLVLELDSVLAQSKKHYISFLHKRVKLDAVHLRITNNKFYLIDGSVPFVFSGNTADWKAHLKMKNAVRFSIAEVLGSTDVVFRKLSDKNGENVLGTLNFSDSSKIKVKYHPILLQKQIDGVFDTDGAMNYSDNLNRFVYVYYYRNEFIVCDNNLNLKYRGKTIDTTTKAKIKVSSLKNRNEKKLAAPAFMVNRTSAVYRNLLFVNSSLPGKYEPLVMWKDASIIDVYDIESKIYLMSFYIYNENKKQLSTFMVTGNRLYALIGNSIVCYRLGTTLQKYLKQNQKITSAGEQGQDRKPVEKSRSDF